MVFWGVALVRLFWVPRVWMGVGLKLFVFWDATACCGDIDSPCCRLLCVEDLAKARVGKDLK